MLLLLAPAPLAAQEPDSTVTPPTVVPDSAVAEPGIAPIARQGAPPVSPTGAMVRSLILPGWGQFSLKRKTVGVVFVASELVFAGLVVREQRRINDLRRDGADSTTIASAKQQREDWIILGLVNHVAAGIEAYVAAYLWDFPDELKIRALPGGGFRANVSLPLRLR